MSQGIFYEYATRLISDEKRNRDSWAKELSVSSRTITNFNARLKKEFGIKLGKTNGIYGYYFIDKRNSSRYQEFINFIQNLNSPTKIAESFAGDGVFGEHLIFHQNWDKVSWMKHFNSLLNAINNQHYTNINYSSFRTERDEKLMYFMPYWMKQNAYFRWYVIGFENEKSTFPTVIGLDKINSLNIDKTTFERKASLEKFRDEYENVFGVYIYPDQESETVRIECTRFQTKYLKSLPLHPSQEVEFEDDKITIFKYFLKINHEFAYELLRQNVWNFNSQMLEFPHPHRTAIKVLEPAWLAAYFYQTYKRSYLTYEENSQIVSSIKNEIDETSSYEIPEF